MAAVPSHDELAASFDGAADVYAAARPGYPDDAVDWLLEGHATARVLDLGAGTGKLTERLAERPGLTLTAVEPSENMRAELTGRLGERVRALPGSAEAIPLPDAAVDVVLVAQAWHWVDPDRAVPEVARVLAPGGRLGLLWNRRDETVGWVAELSALVDASGDPSRTRRAGRASEDSPRLGPPLAEPERFVSARWFQTLTPEDLVSLVASRSYVITLPGSERAALLERIRTLAATHPDLAGRDRLELPYRTYCVRAARG